MLLARPSIRLIFGIAACLLASAVRADVVTLKDGGSFTGVVTYDSEKVVSIKSDGVVWTFDKAKVSSVQKEETGRAEEAQNDLDRRMSAKHDASRSRVVVYGTAWCGFCKKARNYFASRGIPFVDKDVERDPGAREEVSRKCAAAGFRFGGGVPVLDVHGHILRGFDAADIEWALHNRDG